MAVLSVLFGICLVVVWGMSCGKIARDVLRLPFWPFAILGGLNIIICAVVLLIVFLVQKSKGTFAPTGAWANRGKSGSAQAVQPPVAPSVNGAPAATVNAGAVETASAQTEARPAFCPGCGAPVPPGGKFCGKCGFQL